MSSESTIKPISYRPDLPDWGVYLRPPQAGTDWMHPEDVQTVQRFIPSPRVWRRSRWDGEYYWLHYGSLTVRVRPTLWQTVPDIDLNVGDQVELLSRCGVNDAGIYRVAEILYSTQRNEVEYYLQRERMPLGQAFHRDDLQPLVEQHQLRVDFYEHEPPKANLPDDLDLLDVGDLLDE